jgi:hypothetical protein
MKRVQEFMAQERIAAGERVPVLRPHVRDRGHHFDRHRAAVCAHYVRSMQRAERRRNMKGKRERGAWKRYRGIIEADDILGR